MPTLEASARQKVYYAQIAQHYNTLEKVDPNDISHEHNRALRVLSGFLRMVKAESVLDVGSGTGRALKYLRDQHPEISIRGLEPVAALREVGISHGIPEGLFLEGHAEHIPLPDASVDVVCEFGVLHHTPHPEKIVAEMLRVARKAVFISDSNNFGQGSRVMRAVKLVARLFGLWKACVWLRTGGKMYMESAGDGVFYSFSVFDLLPQLADSCSRVHVMNTSGGAAFMLVSAPHVVAVGIKTEGS